MNISLAAEPLFHIGAFAFTNTLLVAWLVMALLAALAWRGRRSMSEVPRGIYNAIEALFEALLKIMDPITGERRLSLKFFPVVVTIFLFVLFSNFIEVIPGLGTIGLWREHEGERVLIPFLRSASADLNVTMAIGLISVLATQWLGIATLGIARHAGKFLVPPWKPPYFIGTFVGILELIGEAARVISFSFRLFGNIFAGEVLLTVMLFLVPYLVPLPFLFLEVFVGLVQAAVFAMLTLVFMKMSVTAHDEHEAHG